MEIITDEKIRCVSVKGRLDANSSNDVDFALMALPENGQDIILDLSACHYLSSAGIRIILKTNKKLQAGKNELIITGTAPEILRVLEIAGLKHVLHFETSVGDAVSVIMSGKNNEPPVSEISVGHHILVYQPSGGGELTGQLCLENEILSYYELGLTLGFGSISEENAEDPGPTEFFAALECCCGFIPMTLPADPDFRITSNPQKTGLLVFEALSFGHSPSGSLKLKAPGLLTFRQLNDAIKNLKADAYSKKSIILLLVANLDKNKPSLSLVLNNNADLQDLVKDNGMNHFHQFLSGNAVNQDVIGITFRLADLDIAHNENSLPEILARQLTFQNILAIEPFNPVTFIENPLAWIFHAGKFVDGRTTRLAVTTKSGTAVECNQAFLTRLLYTDSARLLLEPLQGGYVAQTFQVTSYDQEGRKMRPTVLKIARREVISRESERCRQYALPYIFNNSAVILGTEYYGNTGALRYNFVGLGGESSRPGWLTNYYKQSDISILEPLFDKIMLEILNPWYGQPVSKTIFPFREHDPTFTFFPHIYQTVSELFSISADEKYINIQEESQPILNPYWFLKHEFAGRRDWSMEYFTGICHGDLNMQNILLDENMNIHLIDFSETKPRPVISDFARLEAIFLIEFAPVENESDLSDYLKFIREFYSIEKLDDIADINYAGKYPGQVRKNALLSLKMRKYALDSAKGNPDPLPYYVALLEWVLPVVCYTLPVHLKRISMIISSILCEKVMAATAL